MWWVPVPAFRPNDDPQGFLRASGYGTATVLHLAWRESLGGAKPPRSVDAVKRWLHCPTKVQLLSVETGSFGMSESVTRPNSGVAWCEQCLAIETTSKQARAAIARSHVRPRRPSDSSCGTLLPPNTPHTR